MTIDPRIYEKYSGRTGDPQARLGAALAKNAKAQAQRDQMPKGVSGGLRMMRTPGIFSQIWFSRPAYKPCARASRAASATASRSRSTCFTMARCRSAAACASPRLWASPSACMP